MSLLEPFLPALHIIFTFILIALFFVFWKAINSYWIKRFEIIERTRLKKGEIEYTYPPRPRSKNFDQLMFMTLMTTSTRQEQLTLYFSNLIREYFEFESLQVKCSESLNLLINDPNAWLKYHYNNRDSVEKQNYKKSVSEFLYEEYVKIIKEIEEIINLPLISERM